MYSNRTDVDTIPEPRDTALIAPSDSGSLSPIATLPPELLGEVFLWTCKNPRYDYRPMLDSISATHVCHYWREVGLNTPLLWRDIDSEAWGARWSSQILQEVLRRSGQTPLHLRLHSDDLEDVELIITELHRIEDFVILQDYFDLKELPELTSDVPILRALEVHRDIVGANVSIPFVSPKSPLKLLESIDFTAFIYSNVSQFFRPTMKRLSLHGCKGGTVVDLLHALRTMPLLETIYVSDMFGAPSLAFEQPMINLCFLQDLNLSGNDALSCSQILNHILFPVSTRLFIGRLLWGNFDADAENPARRISEAITSKAAGNGVLGTAILVHTLHVRRFKSDIDRNPTVCMWTDDPTTYGVDEPEPDSHTLIPQTQPFCECAIYYDAGDALQLLCSAGPYHLRSIRTLIMSCYNMDDLWCDADAPRNFWSDSLRCLVGLESLRLDCVVWDGLATPLVPVRAIEGETMLAELPFPRLRLLSLSCISFRLYPDRDPPTWQTPGYRAEQHDFVLLLKDMLETRKRAGIGLAKLVISNSLRFSHENSVMLGTYVDEVEWDGRTEP